MNGRTWRWLPVVLLASVWMPACQESDDEAGYDAAGAALYHRAWTHDGAPSSVINVEGRGNLIAFVIVVYPALQSATSITECSLQSRWGPVDRSTAISFDDHSVAAQPVDEHDPGPRAVDFGLAYDVVSSGWTGVSATD